MFPASKAIGRVTAEYQDYEKATIKVTEASFAPEVLGCGRIEVNTSGPDLAALDTYAKRAEGLIAVLPGFSDVKSRKRHEVAQRAE